MSTALSRSGPTAGTTGACRRTGIASATAAVQAAWAALVAYYHRLRCGTGEYVDFSRFEGVVQALDPPFGSEGQAAVGQKRSSELWRGRPRNQQIYPIFPCSDGFVRICLLSPRQWRGMRGVARRAGAVRRPEVRDHRGAIRGVTRTQRSDRGSVRRPDDGRPGDRGSAPWDTDRRCAHARGGVVLGAFSCGRSARRRRTGPRSRRVHSRRAVRGRWSSMPDTPDPRDRSARTKPLGRQDLPSPRRQVVPRASRLRAANPGPRRDRRGRRAGPAVRRPRCRGHQDRKRRVSRRAAADGAGPGDEQIVGVDPPQRVRPRPGPAASGGRQDIRAGLSRVPTPCSPTSNRERLPRWAFPTNGCGRSTRGIVLAESSAFGATGPWSERMGYGPLVRATTGVTRLWTSEEPRDGELLRRHHDLSRPRRRRGSPRSPRWRRSSVVDRTGTGAHVHISQAEAAVNQLATAYVAEAARAAGLPVADDDRGARRVSVRRRRRVVRHLAASTTTTVQRWPPNHRRTRTCPSGRVHATRPAVAEQLQARGRARRADEPSRRRAGRSANHLPKGVRRHDASAASTRRCPPRPALRPICHIAPAELRPAPMPGEHTREICQKLLGLDADETDRLIAEGVLFAHQGRS